MVDRSSGQVRWRLAKETTQSQHNPSLLENGHVLVFDNGNRRNFSRVIEIDPESQEIVWEYTGEPRDSFFSQNISGCQRLPNGNTLICEGRSGRLFEVTPDKRIVWEYINPAVVVHRGETSRAVFRALRYPPGFEGLRGQV